MTAHYTIKSRTPALIPPRQGSISNLRLRDEEQFKTDLFNTFNQSVRASEMKTTESSIFTSQPDDMVSTQHIPTSTKTTPATKHRTIINTPQKSGHDTLDYMTRESGPVKFNYPPNKKVNTSKSLSNKTKVKLKVLTIQ